MYCVGYWLHFSCFQEKLNIPIISMNRRSYFLEQLPHFFRRHRLLAFSHSLYRLSTYWVLKSVEYFPLLWIQFLQHQTYSPPAELYPLCNEQHQGYKGIDRRHGKHWQVLIDELCRVQLLVEVPPHVASLQHWHPSIDSHWPFFVNRYLEVWMLSHLQDAAWG